MLITFEGGEGTGKSTQIARLAERLRARGIEPVVIREPGGTPLAEAVRAILLDPGHAPSPLVEALLVETARADLVDRVIRPALERGRVVLCDRFADSTLAYQGAGRGLDRGLLAGWNRVATGGIEPALTLLLDMDAELGLRRRAGAATRPNRLDREPAEFHRRVREGFLALAAAAPERFVVLDAAEDQERVAAAVWSAVEARLARAGAPPAGREPQAL